MEEINISSDWEDCLTANEIEEDFSHDGRRFSFKGPGWYDAEQGELLLIVRSYPSASSKDQRYNVYSYSEDTRSAFKYIANAPTYNPYE